jgi:hypothetical protein
MEQKVNFLTAVDGSVFIPFDPQNGGIIIHLKFNLIFTFFCTPDGGIKIPEGTVANPRTY